MTAVDLVIEGIGHRGDGIARVEGQAVFVAGALPGETVRAEVRQEKAGVLRGYDPQVIVASAQRTDPVCRHFGTCGGCSLQHMSAALRSDLAVSQLREALKDRGLETHIAPAVHVPLHSRRRATLAALRPGPRTVAGFHARESHHIVPIEECAVVVPEILAGMAAFHDLARLAMPKKGPLDIAVTATRAGLDVSLRNVVQKDIERLRLPLTEAASRHGLARLSIGDDIIVERMAPHVTIAGVDVVPPPGGFLQASIEAETAMGEIVLAAAGKASSAVDLFSGCGTFALHLARRMRVHAVENDQASLGALDRAARFASGLRPVTTERRDLDYRPLLPAELAKYDVAVFDPPRAGAPEQSARLAASKVPVVIAVSCNPATFARDARTLVDGGYTLETVTRHSAIFVLGTFGAGGAFCQKALKSRICYEGFENFKPFL